MYQNAILLPVMVYQNYHSNVAVDGVSKLSFQCGSRDAKFCVSTIWLDKLLILNILYVVANIEMRHATSLHLKNRILIHPHNITLCKALNITLIISAIRL